MIRHFRTTPGKREHNIESGMLGHSINFEAKDTLLPLGRSKICFNAASDIAIKAFRRMCGLRSDRLDPTAAV